MCRDDVITMIQMHAEELRGFRVLGLRLFGSVARDEATARSDVDLLVSFVRPPGFRRLMKLRFFLEDLLGRKVDLVTEEGLHDRLRPWVERDAIRVA